jgi:hypothetical protein
VQDVQNFDRVGSQPNSNPVLADAETPLGWIETAESGDVASAAGGEPLESYENPFALSRLEPLNLFQCPRRPGDAFRQVAPQRRLTSS